MEEVIETHIDNKGRKLNTGMHWARIKKKNKEKVMSVHSIAERRERRDE